MPDSTPNEQLVSADGDKLSPKRKILFSLAEPINGWTGWLHEQLYNPIFAVMYQLKPEVISTIVGSFRIFDACTDPLMGWLSDRTRSRWGRRRPYIFIGAILSGIWLPMPWMFPREVSGNFLYWWLGVTGVIMTIFSTIFNVPYQTLAAEMTTGIKERTSVGAYRSLMNKLGGLLSAGVFWLSQREIFGDGLTGGRFAFAVIGAIIVFLGVTSALSTPERFYKKATETKNDFNFFKGLFLTFKNQYFLRMGVITLSFATGAFLITGLMSFVNIYYLFGGSLKQTSGLIGAQGIAMFIAGMLGIPLFSWLANRYGKHRSLAIALGSVCAGSCLTWVLINPNYPYLAALIPFLTTPAQTGIWVIVPSMNADVIDTDELKNGVRRDGIFSAAYSWLVKVSMSGAFLASGWIVKWCGFEIEKGVAQDDGVFFIMRVAIVVLPIITLLPAFILLATYPLTTKKMQEIQTELERRRGSLTLAS
jgi:glycoside/pentoside/hexuronide:cation symporter, GPH family